MSHSRFLMHALVSGLALLLLPAAPALAVSSIVDPAAGYEANDRLSSLSPNSHDAFGNYLAVYANSDLRVYDRTTQAVVYDLGDMHYVGGGAQYNSFVTFDPSGNSLWVGYTVGGNVNDRIYQVSDFAAGGTWTYKASLPGNFDLAFSGGVPYVSGLNSQVWTDPNCVWRLDTSGMNNHVKVATVGGFSAGLGLDAAGNLYYATNTGAGDKLLRFSAAQVAQGNQAAADAEVLASLPFGAYDTKVDAAGHVLFTMNETDINWNPLGATLAMWNGTPGPATNYATLGSAGPGHTFANLGVVGDVTQPGEGAVYLNDGAFPPHPGLAEVRPIVTPGASAVVTRLQQESLSVGSGAVVTVRATVKPNDAASTSTLSALSFAGSPQAPQGTLDLNNNTLILHYTGPLGTLLTDVSQWIRSGRNGVDQNDQARWNGPGIITTEGRQQNLTAKTDYFNLGAINNGDLALAGVRGPYGPTFAGQPVDSNAVLVKYTYSGDADLNGIVDGDDYSYWLNGFLGTAQAKGLDGWIAGDFNYDGRVDGDDYTQWLNAFLHGGGPLGDPATGASPVPEPSIVALLIVGLLAAAASRLADKLRLPVAPSALRHACVRARTLRTASPRRIRI